MFSSRVWPARDRIALKKKGQLRFRHGRGLCNGDWSETSKCERQRQEGTKGARAGPIHGPMIKTMIKLGSNRVVKFDGRLDVLKPAQKFLCDVRAMALSRRDFAH
jgi:hypothetical protein